MVSFRLIVVALILTLSLVRLVSIGARKLVSPPNTPKKPVTDVYHGNRVTDDYRWLENAADAAVKHWTGSQNRYARSALDRFPEMHALRRRIRELMKNTSPDYTALTFWAGKLFALKSQPPKNQPFLVTLKSADDPESAHTVVDPNRLNPKGTTAIDFFVPSRDGRLVAVSLSEGGSESGDVHVFEVDTGKERKADRIPRVNGATAGGSLAWTADGSGFWYTRYPRGSERPKEDIDFYQQIYFHQLGTPTEKDTCAIGKKFPRIAESILAAAPDGRYVLVTVGNGDGGEYEHHLRAPDGKWRRLTHFADRVSAVAFGPDQALYLVSRKGAPRGKLLRLPLADPTLEQATTIVPESEAAIEGIAWGAGGYYANLAVTAHRLYVVDQVGGPSQVRVFDHAGKPLGKVPLRPVSSVSQVVPTRGDAVLFRNESFIDPPAWYRFDPATAKSTRTALFRTAPADFHDTEVVRALARSRDGTKVPLTIIQRKGTQRTGRNPTILYGYGGFGISVTPRFSVNARVNLRVWLEQGGIYAVANLRGGSEYGEAWRQAGNLTRKQNVFDDFAACARYLIAAKYTSPAKLAIQGGSNGGLLVGAALTQHPRLFRAAVAHVGIYDMLRLEQHPNGAFVAKEYGTIKDPEQFKALYAYSPYHRVKDGTAYPAVFLLTGANDGRVDPAQSRKMAARLQAATSSGRPVLLRITEGAGHGLDSSLNERIAEQAEVYAFLFQQLGLKYRPAH
jgi:prolyl oligopeptidase